MSNLLSEVHPELVLEWSERNLPLTPDKITYGSNKIVWWIGTCGHELKIPDGVWKIEKMAAQLSSHRVHYEKSVVSLLFRKIWCV